MNKYIKFGLISLTIFVCSFALIGLFSGPASALTLEQGAEAARCDGCPTNLFGNDGVFKQITNTILYIVGVVAVIMLIIGGIKYLVSGGDSKKVTDAKNTILYAIIGLIIALLSFAIVNFVISALPSGPANPGTSTSTSSSSGSNGSGNSNNNSNGGNNGSTTVVVDENQ